MHSIILVAALFLLGLPSLSADQAASFFDASQVREIRIYFDDPNWYNTLYQAHASNSEDPYFPARFQYGDTVLSSIGVRFKGNASFRRSSSVKKSFKLDFNEYDSEAKFLGLKKLNLNNGDLQPDFLREKLFLDFTAKYIPAMRAVHTRVYVNDEYWGLYIAVEEPDKTMMQSRFGDSEDGNLFEAGESNATLAYLGTDSARYSQLYELKTNEAANDYSDLIEFLDILNNTDAAELPAKLEPICDVQNMLYGIALNILFVNLDSYAGSASEFMLYHRQDTGQFIHIHWDLNESFGTTGDGSPRISNPPTLAPFWLPTSSSGPGGGGPGGGMSSSNNSRPLMSKLWADDTYKRTYLRQLARMLREGFDTSSMQTRIQELADLIRADVYTDPNKFYSNTDFETALASSVSTGQTTVLGLTDFVTRRVVYLRPVLDTYARPADLRLNEVMTVNTSAIKDETGAYKPWIEIHNLGPGTVDLANLYLTDSPANPTKWALPAGKLADGQHLILWLDGASSLGSTHAPFTLQTGGGTLYLYYTTDISSASTIIDSVDYPEMTAGQSYIRIGDSGLHWELTNQPTPGADNPATGSTEPATGSMLLYINEIMADNKTVLANTDHDGAFDDWFEIYNPGDTEVSLSGLYLTDNLANPTKYKIPEGVTIPAGGYLIFWADDQAALGALHAAFKLSADGEELGIFAADGVTAIDTASFGKQTSDISYGRLPSDLPVWATLSSPTPGMANATVAP
ncbi:CotH kinase family protein [uncultured Paludibaculum sp.]|uniref:CotH kinase family protein n=1 Tax=uncultured Paludibaculum sp. TaxID=1765020 RepID=UPI002AAB60D3|nr:CotH kinase family protein [uncultured Paludibaculum sp.]